MMTPMVSYKLFTLNIKARPIYRTIPTITPATSCCQSVENSLIVIKTTIYIIMDKQTEGTKSFSCLKIDNPNNLST